MNNLNAKEPVLVSHGLPRILIGSIVVFVLILTNSIKVYSKDNMSEAFKISTSAMEPVLMQGDYILVDKTIYKKSEPRRGDVIVFRLRSSGQWVYIKRLIALAEETVEKKADGLYVNDKKIDYPELRGINFYNCKDHGKKGLVRKFKVDKGFYYLHGKHFGATVSMEDIIGKASKIDYAVEGASSIK